MNKTTVLVTDGGNRSSLAVTRSLGKAGCRVIVADTRKQNLSSCSRYCAVSYQIPSSAEGDANFVKAIREIVIRDNVDIIYPMTEPTILLLSASREQLPHATILACPTIDKIRTVFDKCSVFKLAKEYNVAIPTTVFIENKEDFDYKKKELPEFPLVVKPAMSRIPIENGFITTSIKYASSIEELINLYNAEEVLNYPSMIQKKIVGAGTGLFTLFDNNRHLALFSHERLREKPPSGGVSVVCKSVPLDNEMVESARRLLSAVGWRGVAMVEFKRDELDGKAKLMEINGRFWGSLQLAVSAGIDFPRLLLELLKEGKLSGLKDQYQVGLRMKWILGTMDHLLIMLRNSGEKLNLPTGYPSKFQTIVDFMKVKESRCGFDVWQSGDLNPFFFEICQYLTNVFGIGEN